MQQLEQLYSHPSQNWITTLATNKLNTTSLTTLQLPSGERTRLTQPQLTVQWFYSAAPTMWKRKGAIQHEKSSVGSGMNNIITDLISNNRQIFGAVSPAAAPLSKLRPGSNAKSQLQQVESAVSNVNSVNRCLRSKCCVALFRSCEASSRQLIASCQQFSRHSYQIHIWSLERAGGPSVQ